MAAKQLRLVVDTNVARSASETTHPTSTNCRQCLETIRDEAYHVVVTRDVLDEWKRHRSRLFKLWLTSMFARRLVHEITEDVMRKDLREKIMRHAATDKDREEMLKDVFLLEAGLLTDRRIISMNELDRQRFSAVCKRVSEIRLIIWVNPDKPDEKCIEWLKEGAPDNEYRTLGFISESE